MAVFKIKALVNYGKFVKGMEVEVVTKNSTFNTAAASKDIEKAFEAKYGIDAPSGVYGNKHIFQVIEN